MEMNPTHSHLFGATEKEARFGTLVTDYTMIRAGSAHKANGGYLVIPVEELARNPGSYETLKRTIANQKLEIEELAERLGYITTKSLRPEPIPFDAKGIIVGESRIYYLLYQLDPGVQEKLSTQFAEVSDIIREADFYSKQDGSKFITEEQVRQAVEAKVYRSNLIEEKIEEMIERGSLLVDTAGEKVGT